MSTPARLPEQFGRYRVLHKLGEGGMGAVYLAEDTQLRRRVAIKVPHFSAEDGPEVIERFYREARVAAGIDHPNVCAVHDVGQIDGIHYLSMPYIDGTPLRRLIERDQPWPVERAVGLVLRIAGVLHAVHQKGIMHRDLKPANILLRPGDDPVIMDFGLARSLSQGDRLTRSGVALGTPAYMSPEQILGDPRTIGHATDIYGLGVILYELITGQLPFPGPLPALYGQILHAELPPPSVLRPGLDAVLDEICKRALARNPGQRYATMADFAAALQSHVSSRQPSEEPLREPRTHTAAADAIEELPTVHPVAASDASTLTGPSPNWSTLGKSEAAAARLDPAPRPHPAPAPDRRSVRPVLRVWLLAAAGLVAVSGGLVLFAIKWDNRSADAVTPDGEKVVPRDSGRADILTDRGPRKYRREVSRQGLPWTADLSEALAIARQTDRLVLLAFVSQTDTNSRFNEDIVFTSGPVQAALKQHVLVALYVDEVPEEFYVAPPTNEQRRVDAQENEHLEEEQCQTHSVPLYLLVAPSAKGKFEVLAKYEEGKIPDKEKFVDFLRTTARTGVSRSAPRVIDVPVPAECQKRIAKIELSVDPPSARRGQTVFCRLALDPKPGFHTYPLFQADAQAKQLVTTFDVKPLTHLVAVEPPRQDGGKPRNEDMELGGYPVTVLDGKVTWEQTLVVSPSAAPGEMVIDVRVRSLVADEKSVIPLRLDLKIPLNVLAESVPVDPRYESMVK